MQLFVKSSKRTVGNDVSGKYNLIDIPIDIQDLWMKINLSLAKEDIEDPLNTRNNALIEKCIEYLSNKKMFIRAWDQEFELDRWALSYLISDIALSAFDCWKNVWKVDIDMPKEYLWQFKKDNKEVLDKIKDIERLKRVKQEKTISEVSNKDILDKLNSIENRLSNTVTIWQTREISAWSIWPVTLPNIDINAKDESMNSEFKWKWVTRSSLDI